MRKSEVLYLTTGGSVFTETGTVSPKFSGNIQKISLISHRRIEIIFKIYRGKIQLDFSKISVNSAKCDFFYILPNWQKCDFETIIQFPYHLF